MPWLTYQQIGERFGMNAEAARGRVRRLGWRTQPGNDGRTLAQMPDDVELHPGGVRAAHPDSIQADGRADSGRLTELLAAAEARAERADARADEAGRRADAALALADRLGAQLADAGERADKAARRAEHLDGEAKTLRAAMDELRDGQTLMAETHARDLAEAIRRAEDATVETVRQRMDRLEHDRATSVATAAEAVKAADQLRQAEAERKRQGRWARLRAAWRGE